jgi:hypothetical protein
VAPQWDGWGDLILIALQCLAIVPFAVLIYGVERSWGVRWAPFEFLFPFLPWLSAMLFFAFARNVRYFDWGMHIAAFTGAGSLLALLSPYSNMNRITNKALLAAILIGMALYFAMTTGAAYYH